MWTCLRSLRGRRPSRVVASLVALVLSIPALAAFAQVPVSLPVVSGGQGETITIPVTVGDLSGLDVNGYQFTITYDPAIIAITGVDASGTLTAGSFVEGNAPTPGEFRAAAIRGTTFQGEGTLIRLKAQLLGRGSTALHWELFRFDNPQVAAAPEDGQVTVTNRAPSFTTSPPPRVRPGVTYSYTARATDPDGDAVTITAPTLPGWLTASGGSGGQLTLSGAVAVEGTYEVALRATDSDGATAEQSFLITVRENTPPLAQPDSASTDEDTEVLIDVLANDSDAESDRLQLVRVSAPLYGRARVTAGRVAYTPPADFFGTDSLAYTVSDGMDSARAAVYVTVLSVNDAPGATVVLWPADGEEILVTGDATDELTFAWRAATDPEGDAVRYQWQLATGPSFLESERVLEREAVDTTLTVTLGVLAAALDAAGIMVSETATWYQRVVSTDGQAATEGATTVLRLTRGAITAVAGASELPVRLVLEQNYPNPFNPRTQIRYGLPEAGPVRVGVYNTLGQEVRVLIDGWQEAGWHEVAFDGIDLPSGAYYYRVQLGQTEATRLMLLVK